MALFRQHITVGALLGAVGVVLLYFYAVVTDPLLLVILFVVTCVGSFLPDLDSDTGVPFYTVFGVFTICCGAAVLYYTLSHPPQNIYLIVGAPIGAMLFAWFVLGTIFKHFTHHRGMMHSIPTMLIIGLLAYLSARYLGENNWLALIFAGAAGAGVASHLILDEIVAENTLSGNPFHPRKSLGTAFKFFSDSMSVNLFTYLLLAALIYKVIV
jgi:membrane-bound metal-dependent hydrolase YbcI (DUF457 family)